jgi:hypothetical protein
VQYFPNLLKHSCKFGQTNFKFWKRNLRVNMSIGECRKSSFKPLSNLQVFKKPVKDSIFCLYCTLCKNLQIMPNSSNKTWNWAWKSVKETDLCNNTCQTCKTSRCGFLSCYCLVNTRLRNANQTPTCTYVSHTINKL